MNKICSVCGISVIPLDVKACESCDKGRELYGDAVNKNRQAYYDKYKRDKGAKRFYDSKTWKMLRINAIQRDKGLCQDCLDNKTITDIDEVDHIIPIKISWDKRMDIDNLRGLCSAHHRQKTRQDKIKYKDLN